MRMNDTSFYLSDPGAKRLQQAAGRLKEYLDEIHYHGMYQYFATAGCYYVYPNIFNGKKNGLRLDSFELLIHGKSGGRQLAACLTSHTPCRMTALTRKEQAVAAAMAEGGLANVKEGIFEAEDLQLLSINHEYLLVDAAIHYRMGRPHRIYIGEDTMSLLYYLNSLSGRKWNNGLDLCSGSGILGLALSDMAQTVVSTDIAEEPLWLIPINTALNGKENRIKLRNEHLSVTLEKAQTWNLITCNPPFVAFPEGYGGPVYAKGTQEDGLGYMRDLFTQVPDRLSAWGTALFVASFPGDECGPYFFREVKEICDEKNLTVEAYVDYKSGWEEQVPAIASFLSRISDGIPLEKILADTRRFIQDTLKATHYYLAVLVVRHASSYIGPGLCVFDRSRIKTYDELFM